MCATSISLKKDKINIKEALLKTLLAIMPLLPQNHE